MFKDPLSARVRSRDAARLLVVGTMCIGALLGATATAASAAIPGSGAQPSPPPALGQVTGTLAVTGTPEHFSDPVGVSAECARPKQGADLCRFPWVAAAHLGRYQLDLPAGKWRITGWYDPQPFGGLHTTAAQVVKVVAGQTQSLPLSLTYDPPGKVGGRIAVTGAPPGLAVLQYTVSACPPSVRPPSSEYQNDGRCAVQWSGDGKDTGPHGFAETPQPNGSAQELGVRYRLPLPAGSWDLYVSYETALGAYTTPIGTPVTVVAGARQHQDLTVGYHPPTDGAVAGTLRLLDAPPTSGILGVVACRPTGHHAKAVDCATTGQVGPNGDYEMWLAPGTWLVSLEYWLVNSDSPEGSGAESQVGPPQKVVIKVGQTASIDLVTRYGAAAKDHAF